MNNIHILKLVVVLTQPIVVPLAMVCGEIENADFVTRHVAKYP